MQNRQLRISDELWHALERLAQDLAYQDARGVHSSLIREMVSANIRKWNLSPYVCRSASHVAFITREGDLFYRIVQVLKLNRRREKLPCYLEMKPEKRQHFLDARPESVDEATWLRSRWLLNHFCAWRGDKAEGHALDSHVDRAGIEAKSADLHVDQGAGRVLTREVVVGIRDYVQWKGSKRGDSREDRVVIPVDLLTQDLTVLVMVDSDLYRESGITAEEIPDLGVEFRNREGARFEGEDLGNDPENPMQAEAGKFGEMPGNNLPQRAVEALVSLQQLQSRVAAIVDRRGPRHDDLPAPAAMKAFLQPERFLFFHLQWPSPYLGVEVCARFEKPVRPGGPDRQGVPK
jgi:hypothetical protein